MPFKSLLFQKVLFKKAEKFSPKLINDLNVGLHSLVAAENALIGALADDHQAELVVQHLMVKLLIPNLPSPDLLVQNRAVPLKRHPKKILIPDLIINKVGGKPWGFIELKTLLKDDNLSVSDVHADLAKLCAYKADYPHAAAIFALVGSRARLFSPTRMSFWGSCNIQYGSKSFGVNKLLPQKIDDDFVAVPCGCASEEGTPDVLSYMWEVLPASKANVLLSSSFTFLAHMM